MFSLGSAFATQRLIVLLFARSVGTRWGWNSDVLFALFAARIVTFAVYSGRFRDQFLILELRQHLPGLRPEFAVEDLFDSSEIGTAAIGATRLKFVHMINRSALICFAPLTVFGALLSFEVSLLRILTATCATISGMSTVI